jgi:hypothetical protein
MFGLLFVFGNGKLLFKVTCFNTGLFKSWWPLVKYSSSLSFSQETSDHYSTEYS